MLAAAQMHRFRLFGGKLNRRKGRDLVRTVAERLASDPAAGAPVIGLSFFDLYGIRRLLGDFRLFHHSSFLSCPM